MTPELEAEGTDWKALADCPARTVAAPNRRAVVLMVADDESGRIFPF